MSTPKSISTLVACPGTLSVACMDLDSNGEKYLARAKQAAAAERYNAACPKAFRETDWNHPNLQPYMAQIRQVIGWCPNPDTKGILATGETGRGKTRAIWALYRRLALENGIDARFWTAADWFATLQQQVHFGQDDARGWVETVASRPIVIIDDLGQEAVQPNRSDWSQAWWFRFLDLRIGFGLPLIATTNQSAEQIASRSGDTRADPLIRRLLDLCEVVKF